MEHVVRLSGLIKSSLIDYPSRVSCVVFTQGCNFRCGFCHNPDLIPGGEGRLSEIEFFEFLENRKGKLDGVVITGGEPTVQDDLINFIRRIKDHGFSVKLDTNGSNPEVLETLIQNDFIDYVAMDIKGPTGKYTNISRFDNTDNILKSIEIIIKSNLPHEFRTTVLPAIHDFSDFEEIGKMIQGAKRYTVQGFRDEITFDKTLLGARKFTKEELTKIANIVKPYVDSVAIHENL
jgi:pyruvate formate lyase activating enzyme